MKVWPTKFGWVQRRMGAAPLLALAFAWIAGSPGVGGAEVVPAKPERRTIVVLGNSLAAGLGVDPEQAFPALLQKKIDAAGLDFEVVNAGLSGDTTAGGRRRIDWLLKRRIDVLLLELGGNDGLRGIPIETTKDNLQAIIDRARQKNPQVRIVLAGMQMPPNMGDQYSVAFQRIFPELARANEAALVPFLLEGVGGKPQFNQSDQIHPNVEGHKIVVENVWKILQPLLGKVTLIPNKASSSAGKTP